MLRQLIMGCDISKGHVNFCLFLNGDVIQNKQISNDLKSLENFVNQVSSFANTLEVDGAPVESAFIMEFTGIYNNLLLNVLHDQSKTCYVVNAMEIKNSIGLTRGKNDIVDAQRIAEYAYRFYDKLSPSLSLDANILTLKALRTYRSKIIKLRKQLTQGTPDNKKFLPNDIFKIMGVHDIFP